MDLNQLFDEWEKDCEIDELQLDKASIKISKIHSKWARTLTKHNLKAKKLEADLQILKKNKRLYYAGKLSKKELQDLGWEQFDLVLLKDQIGEYLDADPDLLNLIKMVGYHKEISDFCKEALKQLHSRGYNIKAAVDFQRLLNGS